ncbi:MAG: hypothetical protein ABIP13_03765 [Tepidiformaceae bacterium]
MTKFLEDITRHVEAEEGHAVAWGGGSLLTIVLVVLLLVWLF